MIRFWYREDAHAIFDELASGEHGLSYAAARERLARDGRNTLPETKADSTLRIFLRQFESPLIYLLLVACAVVFALGESVDAAIIFAVLFFNAVVGSIQEGRAQNTLRALKNFVATSATVMRDGAEHVIPDTDVVRGDIIVLQEGEKVPADARLLDVRGLKTDESSLTGESEPVSKSVELIDRDKLQPAEQRNMLFKGTTVVSGRGRAIVVATGSSTVIGGIAETLSGIESEIPLKASIRHLSHAIIAVVALISVAIFALGMFRGVPLRDIFVTVVSLAVSVIPEGLPIVITLVLATGVWRMSKRHALVKKLQAVEALGQASVIAVDKTGTITKNELVVRKAWTMGSYFSVSGDGYEPVGRVLKNAAAIHLEREPDLAQLARIAGLCASATAAYIESEKRWRVTGDPTEAALGVFGEKLGLERAELERGMPLVAEIPFDYRLKYHATVHGAAGSRVLSVLGAPEKTLPLCTHILHNGVVRSMSAEDSALVAAAQESMSEKGLRVIAGAYAPYEHDSLTAEDVGDLVFVGLYGMQDVLRPEVHAALEKAKAAGIRVVMITGDHKVTARAIAREAGIWRDGDRVVTGEEIGSMSELQLTEALARVSVFARVTPEDKLRIVEAYKRRGDTIAMTGDGVNDAPPLVAADLGVAMGTIGTEVAKEAADIVLLDDNFGSIVSAVEEGRSIYKTIKKVILYLFSTSLGEVLTISGALVLGFPLPLLASQIIWLNFVTDGFLTVALAMEPKEKDLLKKKFEKPKKYLIDRAMATRMMPMAITMALGTLFVFSLHYESDMAKALTMSLTVLAVFQWFNAWNCRSETESVFAWRGGNAYLLAATGLVVGLQLLAVYTPVLQSILHTAPLSLVDWLILMPVAASIVVVEEVRKAFARRGGRR